jgi:hypothetical protein
VAGTIGAGYPQTETLPVRSTILGTVITLMGVGCGLHTPGATEPEPLAEAISVVPSASPYSQVTAGPVSALVPDGWRAEAAGSPDDPRYGFIASPRLRAWERMDGSTTGMAATWVDATVVGVPSDYYYLAASGPLMSRLTGSAGCRPERQRVLLDHRPSFAAGRPGSAGDYMASGTGTCNVDGSLTRWAYFVAAPGFGPVRGVGIPSSGLYVAVAVMRESARAPRTLRRLIRNVSFAGSSVPDLVSVAGGKRIAV